MEVRGDLIVQGLITANEGLVIPSGQILTVAEDTDAVTKLGRLLIDSRVTDTATLSHIDQTGNGKIEFDAAGKVAISSGPGESVQLKVNGNNRLVVTGKLARVAIDLGVNDGSDVGGGEGVIAIANATTVPTLNPTGGLILYSESGDLKYRKPSGDIIVVGEIPTLAQVLVAGNNASATAIIFDDSMDTDFTMLKQENGRVDLGYSFQNGGQIELYHEDYVGINPTFAGQLRVAVGGDNASPGQSNGAFVIVGVNNDSGTQVFRTTNTGFTSLTLGTSINEFSIDGTLAGNSDDAVPTEKAVKTYVDAEKSTLSRTLTLDTPTASNDITIFRTDVAITVQEVIAVSTGTTPSTTYQLKHHTDRNNAGNALTTSAATTSTTTGDTATLSDGTIPADSWVWIETTAASGTSVILSVDIRYTED